MKIRRDNIAGNGWLSHYTNLPHAVANKLVISLNETAVLWRRITLRLVTPSLQRLRNYGHKGTTFHHVSG